MPIQFPVPWAADENISFLITPGELHTLLQQAGFNRIQTTDETAKGIAFFDNLFNRISQKGLPALGLHILMGNTALEKLRNLHSNLISGAIVLESGIYQL